MVAQASNPYLRGIKPRPAYACQDVALSSFCAEHMMDRFFARAGKDPGIGPLHIALFAVLVHRARQSGRLPLRVYSRQGMVRAGIYSRATYYRLLRTLHQRDYLYYQPSMHHKAASRIWIPR